MDTSVATVRPHAAAAHPEPCRKEEIQHQGTQENHPIIQSILLYTFGLPAVHRQTMQTENRMAL